MKRIFKIVLVLMTIFVLQLTALAAGSPHLSDKITAVDRNGNPVNIIVKNPSSEIETSMKNNAPESVKVTPASGFSSRQIVLEYEIEQDAEFPVTIKIDVEGVTPKSDVKVLIYTNAEMTEYVVVDAVAGDGWIKITLDEGDPLNGFMLINYTVWVKSPKTQADYTSLTVLVFSSFVLLSAMAVYKIKLANQKSK